MRTITDADIALINAKKLIERFQQEPAYTNIMFGLLAYASTKRTTEELITQLKSLSEHTTLLHSPATVLSWIVELSGLDIITNEDGSKFWKTSDAGLEALNEVGYSRKKTTVIDEEDIYRNIYIKILKLCLEPRSKEEIEDMLESEIVIGTDKPQSGFFIDNLECVGALEWQGKWKTVNHLQTLPEIAQC
jgi:hypothetical protein